MGTEDLEEYKSCNLLNPEMWYQKECYFIPGWAKQNLIPVDGSRYDESKDIYMEYELPLDKVQKLIDDCNTALKCRYMTPESAARVIRPLFDDGECVFKGHYEGYGEKFYEDLYKLATSMEHLLIYRGEEEDIKFLLNYSY